MARPRTCPHCNKPIPVRRGYKFDDSMNMVCGHCNEIVFPADKEAEGKLKDKKRKGPTTTTYGSGQWPHHRQYYGHGGYNGANRSAHGAHAGVGADY